MRPSTYLLLGAFATTLASPTTSPVDDQTSNKLELLPRSVASVERHHTQLQERGVAAELAEAVESFFNAQNIERLEKLGSGILSSVCTAGDSKEYCLENFNAVRCSLAIGDALKALAEAVTGTGD